MKVWVGSDENGFLASCTLGEWRSLTRNPLAAPCAQDEFLRFGSPTLFE